MHMFLARPREPVDGVSLAVFRIAFGAILLWEVFRHVILITIFLARADNPERNNRTGTEKIHVNGMRPELLRLTIHA